MSDIEEAGDEDVFRKVRGDLDAAGVGQSATTRSATRWTN